MRCRICRYMYGISEMHSVTGERDVYIAEELTSRPTIRVVSHL